MRHFAGFIVGLLLAPVVVAGVGWVQPRLAAQMGAGGTFAGTPGLVAAGALCVLALVVAVAVAAPRLTPLLPGVAGLALFGISAAVVMRPDLLDRVPGFVPGMEGAAVLLPLGVFLPVAVLMVVPLLIPSRWVRDEPGGVTEDDYFDGLYDEDYENEEGARTAGPGRPRRRHAA